MSCPPYFLKGQISKGRETEDDEAQQIDLKKSKGWVYPLLR